MLFENDRVVLYDKRREDPRSVRMVHIDYGLSVLTGEVLERLVPPGARVDLADVYRTLSLEGQLAGHEVHAAILRGGLALGPQGSRGLSAAHRERRAVGLSRGSAP